MIRMGYGAVFAGLVFASMAPAQAPAWGFRWQPGQILNYRVEQLTQVSESMADTKEETTTRLGLVKRWQVLAVDPSGVATLQMTLPALRYEVKTPRGEVLLFDSANLEKSDPQMARQMGQYVGQPLVLIRADSKGQVVEVKECKHGPASRFESDPPFKFILPDAAFQAGQSWERSYAITLEPPQGTGEKFPAAQKYTCKKIDGTRAILGLSTTLKGQPEALADRIPLLQMQPEGELVFDTQSGCLVSVHFVVDKELMGHQGEGSSYRFRSVYTEELTGNR